MSTVNSFGTRTALAVGGRTYQMFSLPALERAGFPEIARLPFSLKILLENLLRHEDGRFVKAGRHRGAGALGRQEHGAEGDLLRAGARAAAGLHRRARRSSISRRCATASSGSAAIRTRSIRCSRSSSSSITRCRSTTSARRNAFQLNAELEFARNRERYAFLRWGQNAFDNFRVVPPDTGIVHQVNLEYLARVDHAGRHAGRRTLAYPDTLVGTDSHTTMVNGLGVVGWGVGGIEAEAAMLGQPISMLIPQVLGFRLIGTHARRRDRDRPRADDHREAAQARRRRQVRRVLRAGPRAPDDRRPRDARQHVSGVRRDDRDLPDRRDDARLPAADRPRRRAGRAGRGVREGAGAVPHRPASRIRSTPKSIELDLVDGRAEPRRAEAAAGSRVAEAGEERVPGRAQRDDGVRVQEGRGGGRLGARGGDRRRRVDGGGGARRDHGARARRGRHRRDHQLHQHLESERDDRRRPGREEGGRARPDAQAVGEDQPGARLEGRHRVSARRRASTCISTSSASTSSATAARPASATAVRCRTTCRRRSKRATSSSRRC